MASDNPLGTLQNPIVTQGDGSGTTGELSVLETGGYDISVLKYPENVGSDDVPHYVVFNIYVPEGDQYAVTKYGSSSTQSRSQNNIDYLNSATGKQKTASASQTGIATAATLQSLQSFVSAEGGIGDSLGSALGSGLKTEVVGQGVSAFGKDFISFKPKIRRINKSIAIYMPDTVMTSFNHDYGTVSATDAMGKLGLASALGESIVSSLTEGIKDERSAMQIFKKTVHSPGGTEALGMLSEASGLVGPGFTDLALKSAGIAVNPQVELLYRGTANRSFIFEFKFQSRSRKESRIIQEIIQTFKMFSSPSVQPNTRGRYFLVPGQFDITFKFGNVDNQFISQISTCVLEAIDVNYAGAGQFATFDDGAPVDISVQLRFREGEIITRELMAAKGGF